MSHHTCEGDHDHDDSLELGIKYSLYQKVDKENVECLNEATEGSGKSILKAWEDRLDFSTYVESDVDQELLFNIPFSGNVKLKGIVIMGGDSECHPASVKIFKNRPHMTFDDINIQSDQEFELQKDVDGSIEYPTKIVTFSSVYHLTLYFPNNFGSETTRIYYIGLRGDFFKQKQQGVVIATYEARANISDHKNPIEDQIQYHIH